MKSSLKYIKGKHDFTSFRSSGCQANSPERNVLSLSLERENKLIIFTITANAFFYHMVRNIVGSILDVGTSKLKPNDINKIMNEKNRKYCSKMAISSKCFIFMAYDLPTKISN